MRLRVCIVAVILVIATQSLYAAAFRYVTDIQGSPVRVPVIVHRIGTNFPAVNEVILLLGGADKLVATMPFIKSDPWFNKVYPRIQTVPAVFTKTNANVEELLETRPDVVILGSGSEMLANKIKSSSSIPIITLYEYKNPEELKKAVLLIGTILGSAESKKANEFVRYYDGNIKKIRSVTMRIAPSKKPKVYYAANNPLNTEGVDTMANSWITLGGGINVAAQAGVRGVFKDVSIEDVVRWNPDIIVVRDAKEKVAILRDSRFSVITAVKKNRIYITPRGVFPWSVRSADAALQVLWAAKTFHPNLFPHINLMHEVQFFYRTYYHYNLTVAEIQDILYPTR